MKKLAMGTALALCLLVPSIANAVVIDLPDNPTSATGHFSNNVGGGAFADQITFGLTGLPIHLTFASATNDFITATDRITNFAAQLFQQVGAIGPGGGADIPVSGIVNAVACPTGPVGCQILAGSAVLGNGDYYLNITGIGGGTSGYGGNLTTFAVPGPALGAGLPGLLAAIGGFIAWRRRKQAVA